MPKPPSRTASGAASKATREQAEALAKQLADKPYGGTKDDDKPKPMSISLPRSLIDSVTKAAFENKMAGRDEKTVSAIVRRLLEEAGY